jgi:hypothetical protein
VGRLKGCNHLLAGHRWKGVQKFFEAVTSFEVVYKIPKRHSSVLEHRGAAENVWIAVNNRRPVSHAHLLTKFYRLFLCAIDIQTGSIAWELPQTGAVDSWGGTLSTAGGLVISATTPAR